MSKCDCCGKNADEGTAYYISWDQYWVCSECLDKIKRLQNGELNPDEIITSETPSKLAKDIAMKAGKRPPEMQAEIKEVEMDNQVAQKTTVSYNVANSTLGSVLKTISMVVLVLSVLGSFYLMSIIGFAYGMACLLMSVLLSLTCYGVGEICCKVTAIESKL